VSDQPSPSSAALPQDDHPHFVGAMGLRTWAEGETTFGSAAISELLCVPGTA
jgi:hypothetical protein